MGRMNGMSGLKQAIRKAGPALRKQALKPVRKATRAMHRDVMARLASYDDFHHGKVGMQNKTGNLRRYYRYSVSEKALLGRVGLLSANARRAARHAHFFFNGTVSQPARPAHDDAFERFEDEYIRDQKRAMEIVLRGMGGK